MKKLFAMLMALTILMTMAACGQQTTDEAGGTVDPGAVADRDTSGQVDMPADDAGTPELGSVNGGTYTNEFAGIGCTLDETWTFYTEAQIAEINGFLTEGTSDEDMRQLMEENQSVYDMYASSTDGLMTMNVVFQNMGLLFGTTMSAQDYVELSAEQLPDAMGTYGFEDVTASVTTAEFAGAECPAIAITAAGPAPARPRARVSGPKAASPRLKPPGARRKRAQSTAPALSTAAPCTVAGCPANRLPAASGGSAREKTIAMPIASSPSGMVFITSIGPSASLMA